MGGCSSHHLQGAGAYCIDRTAGRTGCFDHAIHFSQSVNRKNTVRIRSAFKLAVKADKEFKNNTTIRVSFSKMSADERLLRKT